MAEEETKKKFTVREFTNVCRFVNCADEESFNQMYAAILPKAAKFYTCEKLRSIRTFQNGFMRWWCELDEDSQEKIVEVVRSRKEQGA